jgi:hypothetical protein
LFFEPNLLANRFRQILEQAPMLGKRAENGRHIRFDSRESLGTQPVDFRQAPKKRSLVLDQYRHGLFEALVAVASGALSGQ